MSQEKRKSIENAIWLCANCSIDIDRDEDRYSTALLNEWKIKAEDIARIELGRKLPSNDDAINSVSAALTGFPKSYISTAISNVHKASEKSLEMLDPRFLVKTSHDNGKTSIGIYAKENVQCSMKISSEHAKQYIEKYQQLFEHGKDLEIDSDAITIEGSKLLEEIFGTTKGVFSISSRKMEATQKLWLVQDETNVIESFDDIKGVISFGVKSFTFEGDSCNKLFSFSYQKSLDEKDDKANISMSLCFEQWDGASIMFLPYYEKLYSLYKKMSEGWVLFTSLEINGIRVLLSKGMTVSKWDYVLDTVSFLHYINYSKVVSDSFNWDIRFVSDVSYTSDEFRQICDVSDVLNGKQVYEEGAITSNATCELIVGQNCLNINELSKIDQAISMKMVQSEGEDILIFGKQFTLPPKIIALDYVLPKIHAEIATLKENDIVKVEWLPQSNFKCEVKYET
ncbi:hypothetical protein A5320_05680 [Rheinheimera sp. SA_1]|nr:hypothetical protein A5320_05680 [Rheinheimera sp. SA_1]